ncbi:hypothetical protein [Streptomyces sp. NPDC127098]|uniref:terpene synthase family protein n=1 Tax=Streptomyces sp. NPDC127098 TaxID=3347137 RepID=UPI00364FFAF1
MPRLESYRVPELPHPHPLKPANHHLTVAGIHMWEWCTRHELLRSPRVRSRLEVTRPDLLAALYYPHADAALLSDIACWLAWAFLIDDEFDEGEWGRADTEHRIERLEWLVQETPSGTASHTSEPLLRALVELLPRIMQNRTLNWSQRFARNVRSWLRTYATEAAHRAAGYELPLELYTLHRRDSYGAPWLLDLCEVENDCELPDTLDSLPELKKIRAVTADCLTPVNDVYSVSRDAATNYLHNAVLLTASQHNCTLQQAAARVIHRLRLHIDAFRHARASLITRLGSSSVPAQALRNVDQLTDSYQNMIAANLAYHREAVMRYELP